MSSHTIRTIGLRALAVLGLVLTVAAVFLAGAPTSAAQDAATTTTVPATDDPDQTTTDAAASDEQLVLGAEVFASSCASCHQSGGEGVPGQFPPLKGNPHVEDGAYVRETILNGLSGSIEVNGETYDADMPAVSGLSDADLDAVIVYVQSGFATPEGEEAAVDPAAGLADGALTGSVNFISTLALLIGVGVAILVLLPRITAAHSPLETTWLDSWMKTGVIVVGVVLLVVLIPNWVLNMSWFSDLDRIVQDLLATAIWGAGLVVVLWSLRHAQRKQWI